MPVITRTIFQDHGPLIEGIPLSPNVTVQYNQSIASDGEIDDTGLEIKHRKVTLTNTCLAPRIMQGAVVQFVNLDQQSEIHRILALHAFGNLVGGSQRDAAIGSRYSSYPLKVLFHGGDGLLLPPDRFVVCATIPGCRNDAIKTVVAYAKLREFRLIDAGSSCLMRVIVDVYNPLPRSLDSMRLSLARAFPLIHIHKALHTNGHLYRIGTDNPSVDHGVEQNHLFVLPCSSMPRIVDQFVSCMLYKRRNMPCGNAKLCILHRNEVMLTDNPPNAEEMERLMVAIRHPLIFSHMLRSSISHKALCGPIRMPLDDWLDTVVYPKVGRGLACKVIGIDEPGATLHMDIVLSVMDRHESFGNSASTSYIIGYVIRTLPEGRLLVPSWSSCASPGGHDILENMVLQRTFPMNVTASIIGDIKSPRDLIMAFIASKDNPHSVYFIPRREIRSESAQYLLRHQPNATHFVLFGFAGMLPLNLADVETTNFALNTMLSADNKVLRRPRFVDECYNPQCPGVHGTYKGLCIPTACVCLQCGATFCSACMLLITADGCIKCGNHDHPRRFVTRQIWPYDSDDLNDTSKQVLGSLELVCRLQAPLIKTRPWVCSYCHNLNEGRPKYCDCLFPAMYCNRRCQERDWKKHRFVCTAAPNGLKPLAQEALDALTPIDAWVFQTFAPLMRASASEVEQWRKNFDAVQIEIPDCLSAQHDIREEQEFCEDSDTGNEQGRNDE